MTEHALILQADSLRHAPAECLGRPIGGGIEQPIRRKDVTDDARLKRVEELMRQGLGAQIRGTPAVLTPMREVVGYGDRVVLVIRRAPVANGSLAAAVVPENRSLCGAT
jgi:hypothetical protein